jgi:hypothetical protein
VEIILVRFSSIHMGIFFFLIGSYNEFGHAYFFAPWLIVWCVDFRVTYFEISSCI